MSRSGDLRRANPVAMAASRANLAGYNAVRAPGPVTHGTSNAMAARCRAESGGAACQVCRDGQAARQRAWQAARRAAGASKS